MDLSDVHVAIDDIEIPGRIKYTMSLSSCDCTGDPWHIEETLRGKGTMYNVAECPTFQTFTSLLKSCEPLSSDDDLCLMVVVWGPDGEDRELDERTFDLFRECLAKQEQEICVCLYFYTM